jgi:hypothetical protein
MALHNLARVASATTGTGTLTLGSAVSGFLTFADAGVANGETVTYAIRDGAASEIGRGVYTTAGTTLTRATIYESTNGGAAINCSGTQEVFITAAAENVWTAPTVTTVTTTNLTASLNTRYILDVSGLTADRNFVVPAGAPGDWIEVNISAGDDTYELIIIGDTGISINGGSTATEWSRLFITGESVRLMATSATNWQVITDKRIPCLGKMTRTGSDANTTHSATTDILADWNTAEINRGDICDTTNDRFNIRRAGTYSVSASYCPAASVASGNYTICKVFNGATQVGSGGLRAGGAGIVTMAGVLNNPVVCAAGDTLLYYFETQQSNIGLSQTDSADDQQGQTFFAVTENL